MESSYFRLQDPVPTDEDLNRYGLTRQQYDEWHNHKPSWRKIDQVIMSPGVQMLLSIGHASQGRYLSAMNASDRTLPEYVDQNNQYRLHDNLNAARNYHYQKSAAGKNQ